MQLYNQGNHFEALPIVAIVFALLFTLPEKAEASVAPQKIVFQTSEFVQVIEQSELANWFSTAHRTVFAAKPQREIEDPDYCPYHPTVCDAFISRSLRKHLATIRVPVLNEDVARTALGDLAAKVSLDPVNAKFRQEEGGLIATDEAVPGRTLDVEKSLALLKTEVEANKSAVLTVDLATEKIPANVTGANLAALGIREVVSVGETDFTGSPKNRIYNIKRAIEQFDGLVIAPNEEFSFVKFLGEVDGQHGYLPELVIKNNQTTPEFGGGICQVSTTMFRAALNAGFKITARKNHAYPVQYYKPYGMDATVYIPNPDLKFMNNSGHSIIMFPEVNGMKLKFTFYGTKDGRTVALDGPHILERNPDGSMKTIFTQTVTDAGGAIILSDKFPSSYKSPSLFPHPGEQVFTSKPAGWSEKQWREYKKIH